MAGTPIKAALVEQIRQLHSEGLDDNAIGKIVGLNYRTVNYHRHRMNLTANFTHRTYKDSYDRIRGYIIRNAKYTSGRREIYFDLKYDDFDLPEYCPLLGLKLEYHQEGHFNSPNHATVDRIDNSKGYIKGNVIVISRLANTMKNEANLDELITFSDNIRKLVDYYSDRGALGSITAVFPEAGNLDLTPSRCAFKKVSPQA